MLYLSCTLIYLARALIYLKQVHLCLANMCLHLKGRLDSCPEVKTGGG